jgi:hypothetical protein
MVGCTCGRVYGKRGKQDLLNRLPNYNLAATQWSPWVVMVDLDDDASCAPDLVTMQLPEPSPYMRFRVAVRAVEAWLLADPEGLSTFLSVAQGRIPRRPDDEFDPKATLVDLTRHSRRRAIREDMVPSPRGGRRVGPGYEGRLIEFVAGGRGGWRPDVAAERSDSLARCIRRLAEIGASDRLP